MVYSWNGEQFNTIGIQALVRHLNNMKDENEHGNLTCNSIINPMTPHRVVFTLFSRQWEAFKTYGGTRS